MVPPAACHFGGLCGQQRVQQAGGAAAVFERGVPSAIRVDAGGWQQVIKHLPLTTAYANKAVTVVWGILLGMAVFGEAVTPRQVVGAVIIIAGIVLFVRADNEEEGGK